MENRLNPKIARRDLFRVAAIGAAVATTSACASAEAAEFPDKRKARYQADSADVQSSRAGGRRGVTEFNISLLF